MARLAAVDRRVVHKRAGEPDEVGEVGKVAVQPVDLGRVRGQVSRDIEDPARGPLEEVEVANLVRQFGRELIAGAAAADDRDPLPG